MIICKKNILLFMTQFLLSFNTLKGQSIDTIQFNIKINYELTITKTVDFIHKIKIDNIVFCTENLFYFTSEDSLLEYNSTLNNYKVIYKGNSVKNVIVSDNDFIVCDEKYITKIKIDKGLILAQTEHKHDIQTLYSPSAIIKGLNSDKLFIATVESGFDVEYKIKEIDVKSLKEEKVLFSRGTGFGMFDMFKSKEELIKKTQPIINLVGMVLQLNNQMLLGTFARLPGYHLLNIQNNKIDKIVKLNSPLPNNNKTGNPKKIKIYDVCSSKYGNFILLNENRLIQINNDGDVTKVISIKAESNMTTFYITDSGNIFFCDDNTIYAANLTLVK